jgi:hypothetical protein
MYGGWKKSGVHTTE